MMISPETYIDEWQNRSYLELVEERKRLQKSIQKYEESLEGEGVSDDIAYCPSPDVVYQCELEYLAKLCKLTSKTFNREIIWDGHPLFEEEA